MRAAKLIFLIFFGLGPELSAATLQTEGSQGLDINIGKRYVIASSAMKQDREIMISLPEGYAQTNQSYPVLYILHGKQYFPYGVAFTRRLADKEAILGVITVGISRDNSDNPYMVHGTPEADQLLDFIEKELFAFVEGNFRASGHRSIAGWHHGGSLALHALVNRPYMFDGYILASPFPVRTEEINFEKVNALLAGQPDARKIIYFGVNETEGFLAEEIPKLRALLQEGAHERLIWVQDAYGGNGEQTDSMFRLMHPGLRTVYSDFKLPSFASLAEYNQQGGKSFLTAFFTKRANKYGVPEKVTSGAVFRLLRLAMFADDISVFEDALSLADMFADTANVNWYIRYAQFYVKYKKYPEAIELLGKTESAYPSSIAVQSVLAEAYEASNQHEKAVAALHRAIELAEIQSSDQLEPLKKRLAAHITE